MQRIFKVLTHSRTLSIIGLLALAAVLFIAADTFQIDPLWPAVALGAVLALLFVVWLWRRLAARRANRKLGDMLEQQAEKQTEGGPAATPARQAELDALRTRLVDAVKTIKTSKIGQVSGGAALYELPWYIVIGNPAAGKSSAVLNSGLQFPFADKNNAVIHGIGGTRNCDWFFTTEGILLDTAGR
jgi:type VI secretion system protein ImpL